MAKKKKTAAASASKKKAPARPKTAQKTTKKKVVKKTAAKAAAPTKKTTKTKATKKKAAAAKPVTKKVASKAKPSKKAASAKVAKKKVVKKTAVKKKAVTKKSATKKVVKKTAASGKTSPKTTAQSAATTPSASKKKVSKKSTPTPKTPKAAAAKSSASSSSSTRGLSYVPPRVPYASLETKASGGYDPHNHTPPTEDKLKKVKTGLGKRDLRYFQDLLLERRAEIIGDVQGLEASRSGSAGEISHMPLHMADVGSDNYEQEFTLGLMESERKTIIEIDEALQRIGKGYYGVCIESGIPIGRPRLEAKPWAKYCIEVARERERRGF